MIYDKERYHISLLKQINICLTTFVFKEIILIENLGISVAGES